MALMCVQVYELDVKISKYFLIVQFLDEDLKFKKQKYRPPHFTVWKWELGPKEYKNHYIACISTESLVEVACVVPMYSTAYWDEGYRTSCRQNDRFWYVHRKFIDRSGWDEGFKVDWGNDDEHKLLQVMLKRQELEDDSEESKLIVDDNYSDGNFDIDLMF